MWRNRDPLLTSNLVQSPNLPARRLASGMFIPQTQRFRRTWNSEVARRHNSAPEAKNTLSQSPCEELME